MVAKSTKNLEKNEYEKQSISRHCFFLFLYDFHPMFGAMFPHVLAFFQKLQKRADMRFDCAMASGLRVGPPKVEPDSSKNQSKMDLEKRCAHK